MKLLNVKIIDFRGLKNISISVNNNILFIVSDNNIGKTRVLSSIDNFFNGKDTSYMELLFSLTEKETVDLQSKYEIEFNTEMLLVQRDKKILYKTNDVTSLVRTGFVFGKCFYIPAIIDYSSESDIRKSKNQLAEILLNLQSEDKRLTSMLDKVNKSFSDYLEELQVRSRPLFDEINNALLFDEVKVEVSGNDIQNNQILKNNLSLKYSEYDNYVEFDNLGAGVQANIICTLLASKPRNQFTIILYDEPETFLNSSKQKATMNNIIENSKNSQYIIATHSPFIVTREQSTINSIVRLNRSTNEVLVNQFDEEKFKTRIREVNQQLQDLGAASKYLLKDNYMKTILVWWETERINAIFTKKIFLVEGPTESIFVDMCMREYSLTTVNSLGKFKIPYYKIFFEELLGIELVVMIDKDNPVRNRTHNAFNTWITTNIEKTIVLEDCIESELGFATEKTDKNEDKPAELMERVLSGRKKAEISSLVNRILAMWDA